MEDLVTLDQVKEHLKLGTGTAQDDDLELKLAVAQEMVVDYVKQLTGTAEEKAAKAAEIELWTDETAPKRVLLGILMTVGYLYKHRGDEATADAPTLAHGDLPSEIKLLLYRLHDPAIA